MENKPPQGELADGPLQERVPQETPPAHASAAPADPAEARFRGLCLMLSAAFGGVLLLTAGLSVMLIWQTRLVRAQLTQSRQSISRFEKYDEPLMREITSKLESYGLQNRDYQPILQKYAVFFPRFRPATNAPAGPAANTGLSPVK